jgi:hypothetical protein
MPTLLNQKGRFFCVHLCPTILDDIVVVPGDSMAVLQEKR